MGIFNEDIESLNGSTTCVGIILPEYIYGYAAYLKEKGLSIDITAEYFLYKEIEYDYSDEIMWLIENLMSSRLV